MEKQLVLLDKFKRSIFIKYELKRLILKSGVKNNYIKNISKYYILYKKSKICRWSSIIQQTNRCFKSGRAWSVNKLTRYSRFVFRREAYSGNIPGFRRASW
jgi:small subunit ribosomal protein S14